MSSLYITCSLLLSVSAKSGLRTFNATCGSDSETMCSDEPCLASGIRTYILIADVVRWNEERSSSADIGIELASEEERPLPCLS